MLSDPLGPLGFNFSQHGPTTRPSVERTADCASSATGAMRCQLRFAPGLPLGWLMGGMVPPFVPDIRTGPVHFRAAIDSSLMLTRTCLVLDNFPSLKQVVDFAYR